MPMSLHETLRPYLAEKRATIADDGVSWTDDEGRHLLLIVEGPLSAAHIVDGHTRARATGARLHVAHAGTANPVAQRTAARFGAILLAEADLAAPAPSTSPAATEPPSEAPSEQLLLAHSEPAPEVAHADDAMPWGGEAPAPEPAPVAVEPLELLAMPWVGEMEHAEELPAGRETRGGFRPTQAPSWGLPWPRPAPPTDGLAIADPKIWNAPQRLTAMRDDLDRAGAPSFGAAKPEGSAWLKRISEFGPL